MQKENLLENQILDILYRKCTERPLWVTDSEVYWSITDMNVSERDVRDTLDRLVFYRKVLKQVGKYQIAKAEFLSIKERIEEHHISSETEQKQSRQIPITEEKKKVPEKSSSIPWGYVGIKTATWVLWLIIGMLLGLLLYNLSLQKETATLPDIELPTGQVPVGKSNFTFSTGEEPKLHINLRQISVALSMQHETDKGLVGRTDSLIRSLEILTGHIIRTDKWHSDKLQQQQALFLWGLCAALATMLILFSINLLVRERRKRG